MITEHKCEVCGTTHSVYRWRISTRKYASTYAYLCAKCRRKKMEREVLKREVTE